MLIPYWNYASISTIRPKYTFSAHKSKCPHRFLGIDPDCLHTCSMSPCQAVDESFFSSFFSLKFWISRNLNIQRKKHFWRKEKKRKHTVSGWQGFSAPSFGVNLRKTAWTLDVQRFWGDMLRLACASNAARTRANLLRYALKNRGETWRISGFYLHL